MRRMDLGVSPSNAEKICGRLWKAWKRIQTSDGKDTRMRERESPPSTAALPGAAGWLSVNP
jgi:hypothetical protein